MRSSKLTTLFAVVLLCSAAALVGAQGNEIATPADEALPQVDAPAVAANAEADTEADATLPEQAADETLIEVDIVDCFIMCQEERRTCVQGCGGDYGCITWCYDEFLDCRRDCLGKY